MYSYVLQIEVFIKACYKEICQFMKTLWKMGSWRWNHLRHIKYEGEFVCIRFLYAVHRSSCLSAGKCAAFSECSFENRSEVSDWMWLEELLTSVCFSVQTEVVLIPVGISNALLPLQTNNFAHYCVAVDCNPRIWASDVLIREIKTSLNGPKMKGEHGERQQKWTCTDKESEVRLSCRFFKAIRTQISIVIVGSLAVLLLGKWSLKETVFWIRPHEPLLLFGIMWFLSDIPSFLPSLLPFPPYSSTYWWDYCVH